MLQGERGRPVDVICEFSKEGNVVPLRVRVMDEDGVYQVYNAPGSDLSARL